MQRAIPYMQLRGGSSKGLYFKASDLPIDPDLRDQVILAVMDGVGPGDPIVARHGLAHTLHFQGELAARTHFEHDLTLPTAQLHPTRSMTGEDLGVLTHTLLAWVL